LHGVALAPALLAGWSTRSASYLNLRTNQLLFLLFVKCLMSSFEFKLKVFSIDLEEIQLIVQRGKQ